jgi:muconolactone delta-isomerase
VRTEIMEFLVTMTTYVPAGTLDEEVDDVRTREAVRTHELAAEGHLLRLWCPAGHPGDWRTLGLFTAGDADELEKMLASMPLRVWRTDEVMPLSPHPHDPVLAATTANHSQRTEFLVAMTIAVPEGAPAQTVNSATTRQAVRARELAAQGYLVRLWTLPGQPVRWRALGLGRARDPAEMAAVVESLPLRAWMAAEIMPLAAHRNDPGVKS